MFFEKRNEMLLVVIYQVKEENQQLMHIEYIFLHNFVYDIQNQQLMQDFYDLQFREYILVYLIQFHKQH
jgi:protein-tyrosine phosphatase